MTTEEFLKAYNTCSESLDEATREVQLKIFRLESDARFLRADLGEARRKLEELGYLAHKENPDAFPCCERCGAVFHHKEILFPDIDKELCAECQLDHHYECPEYEIDEL